MIHQLLNLKQFLLQIATKIKNENSSIIKEIHNENKN
jgi:hypothetical protein